MRGKRAERGTDPGRLHSLLLAVFFFLGVLAGIALGGRASGSVGEELSAYLSAYSKAAPRQSAAAVWALALAYLRWPAAALLLGFTALGAALVPLTAAAFGFFPAYAVSCLVAAFGTDGLRMALCFFGLRYLVTTPCFFLLAADGWQTAMGRLRAVFGKGRPLPADKRGRLRPLLVCLILFLGVRCDLRLSPFLFRVLLERIL